VKERGTGISKADLAHMFGVFYRADNETARKEAGIGVGLYFCHLIVDHHRGEITAASEVGQGTAMTIRIPREFRAESIENISPAA
jgi:signal transduction histidine kinase